MPVLAQSDKEFETAQNVVFAVFTPLFIQDNMNRMHKALENHMSEFCCSQNCQKVFCDTLVAALCQREVFYIGIKELPTDEVNFHLGN